MQIDLCRTGYSFPHYCLNNFFLLPPQCLGETINEDVLVGKYYKGEYEPLRKLRILNLSHNNIHALGKKTFQHIPNLKHLYISHNPLKVLGLTTVAAISATPHLQVIH